ncbi:SIMPL domain-containing protein [bacterium]|nr:SIMPL domain-containing protein [bacterium]MBU1983053.1 SIMPL domain-containing protein [bacterium]
MSDRNTSNHSGLTPGLGAVAVAIVIASILLGNALVRMKRVGDTISVTGSAKREIVSDMVIWRATITAQRPTMRDAYSEIKTQTERVKKFLADNRVPESEITFRALQTSQVDEYNERGMQTGRILGYRMDQPLEVHSSRVDSITALSVRVGDLAGEGITLWSSPPEYLFTGLSELRIEMLGEATKDATARAKQIAEASGGKLGTVRNARMGVFQITPRNSTDVSDWGIYDTSTKEKDITAVVRLSYSLK